MPQRPDHLDREGWSAVNFNPLPEPEVVETSWDEFLAIGGDFADTVREPRIDLEQLDTAFDDLRGADL
jgi:hypothetical protein